MKIITDEARINEIFNRGVVKDVLPSLDEFTKVLKSGKKIKIYIGADPTSDSLHLSHAKNYMFLEELRQLGHEVIILVGDFTAQIGDPTSRSDTRKQLTKKEIDKNVRGWISQISNLMDFKDKKNPPHIVYNSKWLSKLSFQDVIGLASQFTVQQMIERDMFEKRWNNNTPIYLHEFLYPLMQGYDSVHLEVDAELCGTDQIFNALAGRALLKRLKNKEKFVVAVNLMENPKTGELMSKSKGTGVFLSSSPEDMYGALMAQPDEMTELFFINCTRIPLPKKELIFSHGPKEAKEYVALEIVKKIHGEKKAIKAQQEFNKVFSQKKSPDNIPIIQATKGARWIDFLVNSKTISSKSEAKRLIQAGGVDLDGTKILPGDKITHSGVVKIGKKNFIKIEVK